RGLIVLPINDHVNAVLHEIHQQPFTVTSVTDRPSVEEKEIIEHIRKRDFQSLTIRPKEKGFHLLLEKNIESPTEINITNLAQSHPFQALRVSVRNGRVEHATQTISKFTQERRTTGKHPTR